MSDRAFQLTEKAFQQDQLDTLLLGTDEYFYTSKFAPTAGTDIALLVPHGIHEYQRHCASTKFSEALRRTLVTLATKYEGFFATAAFLFVESFSRAKGASPFDFSLDEIAILLRQSIQRFRATLEEDRRGEGQAWEDGLYGELRNIAKNTVECEGPDFFGS